MRLFKFIVISLLFFFAIVPLSYGASLHLEWNPNSETDLAGYKVYYGTSPGTYGNPVDVDDVTEYELTGLTAGVRYYVAITAYDNSDNESEKSDEENGIATDTQTTTTSISVGSTTTTTTTPTTSTTIPATTTTTQPGSNGLSGSVMINNGEEVTSSREVTLTLHAIAEDPQLERVLFAGEELGLDSIMCFSNDGKQWSPFEPYKQTKQWTLEPGNGVKTVYASFREPEGNWISEPVQDQIILDEAQSTCDDPQKLQPLSVTASSESPFYSAENLIDGNPSTIWASVVSLFKKDEYITIDFGTLKKISTLSMYASRIFGVDFFPTNFKIQASQDNTTWIDVSDEQGFVFGQSLPSESWDTSDLDCRYLRIYITNSKTFFLFFRLSQIAEIEAYGCDVSEEPPVLAEENLSNQKDKQQIDTEPREPKKRTENQNRIPGIPSKPTVIFLSN